MDRSKRYGICRLLKILVMLLGCIHVYGADAVQNDLKSLMRRKSHPHQPMLKDDDNYNGRGRPAGE